MAAEVKALAKDPLAWLKSGPGRDSLDAPGWTNPAKDQGADDPESVNLLLRQETQSLVAMLLQVLQPFPEVRAAVADALTADDVPASRGRQPPDRGAESRG